MDYTALRLRFEQSAALRLLRATNAPLVLAVLYSTFKRNHVPAVPESRLRASLESELESARECGFESDKAARQYLAEWADSDHSYVRRFFANDCEEPVYELTPDTERVFQWVESLRARAHVGTESKFKYLLSTLTEIVENASREPDFRIQRLRAEQARLQEQIDEISRTGVAPVYSPTQINERFAALLETARQLLGDFREVERHFRNTTEDIVVRQSETLTTRGGIVGQTIDAQERLQHSTQGQSFYAFWEFLVLTETRRLFGQLTDRVYKLEDLAPDLRGDTLLRSLPGHLRTEGAKVLASNARLVAQLRRILDVQQSSERKELRVVLNETKSLLSEARELPHTTALGDFDSNVELTSLMSKAHWEPAPLINFSGSLEIERGGDYSTLLDRFLSQHPIDFARLRRNIQDKLRSRVQITLLELLEEVPLRNGIVEVLAYIVIAASDGPHVIFEDFDYLTVPGAPDRTVRIPKVVFSNS